MGAKLCAHLEVYQPTQTGSYLVGEIRGLTPKLLGEIRRLISRALSDPGAPKIEET